MIAKELLNYWPLIILITYLAGYWHLSLQLMDMDDVKKVSTEFVHHCCYETFRVCTVLWMGVLFTLTLFA